MFGVTRSSVRLILVATAVCGCGGDPSTAKPSATSKASMSPKAPANTPVSDSKTPRFESELMVSHRIGGGPAHSSHMSTRYENGKPFSAVEAYSTTIKGEGTTLKFEVAFQEHRDGKDVYKVTTTIGNSKGEESTTTEKGYDGTKLVLVENPLGSLTLQPPSKK